jgi:hypothetical protein
VRRFSRVARLVRRTCSVVRTPRESAVSYASQFLQLTQQRDQRGDVGGEIEAFEEHACKSQRSG